MDTKIIITVTENHMQVAINERGKDFEPDSKIIIRANKALETLGVGNLKFSENATINRLPLVIVPDLETYAAVYTPSGLTCCQLGAFDEDDARVKIKYQLKKNISRLSFYDAWRDQGFKVVKL